MNFNEYQEQSRVTAKYPQVGNNFVYPTLGLSGEAGEVAEKIKKVIRDKNGIVDDNTKEEIKKELGDVLWYVAQLSAELQISLDDVAQSNLKKLYDRMERDVLHGEGDNR
ncbi:MAG: nucleoside triphosphate pyrophosphohydrolase family protein [Candidatus Moranbacteria bacterium]|nr:nucleoside triphosphate pyrophosphohydrolase family protein [Candidatus Moranbacteria bacterium]